MRKSFGSLPAIFGTTAIYALWHIGTELPMHGDPLEALAMLLVVGIMCQSVFAITYNGLVIWPLFFTAGVMHDFVVNLDLPDEIGTSMGWPLVGWTLALVVPSTIWWYARKRRRYAGADANV